jgi:hypothetical protein
MKKIFPALVLLMMAFSGTVVLADQGKDRTAPNPLLEEAHTRELHSKKTRPARKVSGKAKRGAPQVSALPVKRGQ